MRTYTLTPGRRYSFGCRYRLGTASNLVMYVSAADNDYVGVTGTFLGTPSQGVWSTAPLSLEGVSQMAYILPERLLALVRPAFDLVLRRIRSLKRCVQACGCKIMTPRYACKMPCVSARRAKITGKKKKAKPNQPESQPGAKPNQPGAKPNQPESQPEAKPNQPESQPGAKPNQPGAKPNQPENQPGAKPNQPESQPGAKPSQPESQPEASQKASQGFLLRGLALQKQRQLLGILPNRISRGHYFAATCTQRFRLRILRRTRSNAGRTSARSLSGRI